MDKVIQLDVFLDKLTPNILNDSNFQPVLKALSDFMDEGKKYIFSVNSIDELKNVDIAGSKLLMALYNYESSNRGDRKGKAEILVLFLIEDSHFSKDGTDLTIFGKSYEVKAYKKANETIAFGVENTFTLTPFGIKLLNLFIDILDKGEKDESFRNRFPFWFDTKNGGGWKGLWRVNKFIGMEISESDFSKLFVEIEKLKGEFDYLYTDDISNLIKDVEVFNLKFNEKNRNILLFVDHKLYSDKAQYKSALVTQARVKMRLI